MEGEGVRGDGEGEGAMGEGEDERRIAAVEDESDGEGERGIGMPMLCFRFVVIVMIRPDTHSVQFLLVPSTIAQTFSFD